MRGETGWRRALRTLVRAKWPILAIVILSVVAAAAALAPELAPRDPNRQSIIARLQPPMTANRQGRIDFPLGSDALGRDVLSRLIYGARISIVVGLAAVLIGGVAGDDAGLVAGYRGGWLDVPIMRMADIQLAFPFILLAIMFLVVLGPGLLNLIDRAGDWPVGHLRADRARADHCRRGKGLCRGVARARRANRAASCFAPSCRTSRRR